MKKVILLFSILLLCKCIKAQVPSYVPLLGLVAYYPFDSSAIDATGNGNDGYLIDDATYGKDRFGNLNSSYLGDGLSAVNYPVNHFPTGNSAVTVSAFFKISPSYSGGLQEIFAWGNNSFSGGRFGMYYWGLDTTIGFESVNSAVDLIKYVPDTLWHNLTITYPDSGVGSTSFIIYFDGAASPTHIVYPFYIMNVDTGFIHSAGILFYSPWTYSWMGGLDDIGIWKRELSSCEVMENYSGILRDTPTFSQAGDTLSIMGNYVSYQWMQGNTIIPGATNANYIAPDSGNYTVIVYDSAKCMGRNSFDLYTLNTNNVKPMFSSFTITPNPATGQVIITSGIQQAYTLKLINEAGQTIKIFVGSRQKETIDVSNLPSGIYDAYFIDAQGNRTNKKLVIKH